MTRVHDVAIIGAGIGGLGAAAMLRDDGRDVVVLERSERIGGTWRDNDYPGCACDVPSILYSWSFAPNPDWDRLYAPRAEIQAYVERTAQQRGLTPLLRLGTEVTAARWEEGEQRWTVETGSGTLHARALVSATGPWHEPVFPDVPGLGTFAGAAFHSSRWNHDADLRGQRVAVVGTGASAIQFVPAIQPLAGQLTVFQRTAHWVIPKLDRRMTRAEKALFHRVPAAQRALRAGLMGLFELLGAGFRHERVMRRMQLLGELHLRRQVADPELRDVLTPRYTLGCKRLLLSNDWYPALQRDNVRVVPRAVREVVADGVVDAAGDHHPADVIVFGTGFTITELPIAERITGRDGRTLDEHWAGSPRAHLGTTVAGFPNLFVLLGPNVGNGHGSAIALHEMQIAHVRAALHALDEHGLRSVDVLPEVQDAFVAEVERRLAPTVWNAGGCASYYTDRTGRNSTLFPGSTIELRRRLARFELAEHRATA